MAPYSYVKTDGSVANVEAPNPDAALASATNPNPKSGVITPYLDTPTDRVNGISQRQGIPDAPIPTTRTGNNSRIDPSSFDTGSFSDYEDSKTLSPGELSTISNQYADQLQKEMDLINANFAPRIAAQTEQNRAQLARTKVLNSNTGLIDSGTGVTAQNTTEKKGQAALDEINSQKEAQLGKAISDIDSLKYSAVKEATAQKSNDLVAYNDLREKNATKAQDTLRTYIQAGGDVDQLKTDKSPNDPNGQTSYDALAKALGGEDILKAYSITYAPKDAYVSDKPEIVGNKAIWFVKKSDGTIAQQSIDLPQDKSIKSVTRVPGEGLYVFHTDGTYDVLGGGGSTGTTKSTGNKKQDVISRYTDAFVPGVTLPDGTAVVDDNGYVTPVAWKQAINEAPSKGITRAEFIKEFGHLLYGSDGKDIPASYGLSPAEKKLLTGSQSTSAAPVNPFATK